MDYQRTTRPGGEGPLPGREEPIGVQSDAPVRSPVGGGVTSPMGGASASMREDRSLTDLIKELRDESGTLVRQEVALAKTELGEKVSRYGKDLASIAVGGAVALVGALALVTAVAFALAALLHLGIGVRWPNALWISWGILGLATAGIGYVLLNRGLSDLKRQSPVPEKTVQSLKEDQQWLASKTH